MMRWVRVYADEPQWVGPWQTWHLIAELNSSLKGTVLDEAPGLIRLASEQEVGLFVRPLLPRTSNSSDGANG